VNNLTCRCGASWQACDVVLFTRHIARCSDAKRITARENAQRDARQKRDMEEAAENADYELTPYEKRKQREWMSDRTISPDDAARRVNALVIGRLKAIKKARAAARAINTGQPAQAIEKDGEIADELLRQRGTGSIGAKLINDEEDGHGE
jgi:hypothetical protein